MKNWIIVAILVLVAAAAYYFFVMNQPVEPEVVSTAPVVVVKPPKKPVEMPQKTEPLPPPEVVFQPVTPPETDELPLPLLMESDPVVLEALGGLMGESAVIRYVVSDNVISRIVATTDMLESRQVPGVVQAVMGPESNFAVTANDQPATVIRNEEGDEIPQFFIDPANYARYTPYVELLEAVDTARLVENYRSHYPLFQQAYRQMGYADGEFNDRLREIIDLLLATPEVTHPVELLKPEAYFLFVDPDLEALPAGQKILLRMGNENAARVKSELAEIREQL